MRQTCWLTDQYPPPRAGDGPLFPESHGQGKAEEEKWDSLSKKGNGHQVGKTVSAPLPKKPQALPGVRGSLHTDQDAGPVSKCHVERKCDRVAVIVSPAP